MLHVAEEKRRHRRVSRICDTGDIPLPRSLTRYARSFGCGERYRLTDGDGNFLEDTRKTLSKEEIRPRRSRFSIGSAPLTSITKSDAQISGGETRQDLKMPGISSRRLPLALSCSRHAVYVLWWKPYLNHHAPFRLDSSLQAGLYARTPRSARLPRHSGNYQLESNPEQTRRIASGGSHWYLRISGFRYRES